MTKYLIIASLLLLGIFEVLWLRKVWREQYDGLKQETEYIFQRTVANLQDSLVRRSMARNNIQPDSVMLERLPVHWNTRIAATNSLPPLRMESKTNMVVRLEGKPDDRLLRDTVQYSKVQVFIATTGDSLPTQPASGVDRLLLNLHGHLRQAGTNQQVFQIQKDTLTLAELNSAYRRALRAAGIPLPFTLVQFQHDSVPPTLPQTGGITTQPAFAGLLEPRFYTAVFPEYRGYVLRKMLPSGAFALLLFGMTTAAFALIYRGLQQQKRLTRLKNEFISNVTHELKTPITTVSVALEALSDFEALQDPVKTREYLALSKLELDRLSLLVDKVLRLSMFEQQEHRLKPEPLDLAGLVRQVGTALRLQAERVGASIRFDIPDSDDFTLTADRLHLSSVLYNLFDNALKYGGANPDILVSLEKTPGGIRLRVRDNGIGIPPEYQSKIFDKFFRVPSGDNRHDVKGHGLGLSYVAEVVRQHGGSIRVESEVGNGSTFIVDLPAAIPGA